MCDVSALKFSGLSWMIFQSNVFLERTATIFLRTGLYHEEFVNNLLM